MMYCVFYDPYCSKCFILPMWLIVCFTSVNVGNGVDVGNGVFFLMMYCVVLFCQCG
ncbi:hypothetical protein HanOQP8_Chr14g0547981 [Helianthus annuus]|nr:hypothetical protein HanOQP8_Chr14g0547981 [Helianthus annuus]KAJ0842018.1 hypothetical protein HanPSC8_Chr14g0636921 [Helianthus annuus]